MPTVLLGIYTCVVAVVFYQLISAWPHAGNWKQLILVLMCPGIAINVSKLLGPKVRSRTRRVLERLLSLVIGIPAAIALAHLSSELSFDTLQDYYAPFIAEVRKNLPKPCALALVTLENTATLVEYNRSRYHATRPKVTLHFDARRFVASLPGGSIDIDGSTLYFDSNSAKWRRFHNDDRKGRERFNALTENLDHCQL